MSLFQPADRTRVGVQQQTELQGKPAAEPSTLLESSWRDFIFAEVWTRPALDRRSRFLISIAGVAGEGSQPEILDGYVRGALKLGELTLVELREAALHLAVYGGWSSGTTLDKALTRVAAELGLPTADFPAIRATPWDPQQRIDEGAENFTKVMTFSPGKPTTAFLQGGILNFVFGEMWTRPGLDERSRRWITMVGVANSASVIPIRSHTHAAMASGNATLAEMHEFVLQYAVHAGWPKASVIQSTVFEMGERVAKGLPFQ